VEYHEIRVREVLNRSTNRRLPFVWTVNPYRGCEFACTYCYARYTHGFFDLERWQDFEQKVFVKQGAPRALRERLRRASLRGEPIAIGTATDPYQPAEHRFGVTRSLLEVLKDFAGLDLSITTKSPLILRDLQLLREVSAQHRLTVHVTVTCVDAALARRLEQHAPDPRTRLDVIERLAAAGIATSVFCMPVMPGINDGEGVLRPLFEAVSQRGAFDVVANSLFLRPAARQRFLPWLAQDFPELAPLYRWLYGKCDYLAKADEDRLLETYRRLRREFGFPRKP
jgi:DNA repair photolyase